MTTAVAGRPARREKYKGFSSSSLTLPLIM